MKYFGIRNLFVKFLQEEKEYPVKSISSDISISNKDNELKIVELIIISPENKDILAVISFDSSNSMSISTDGFRKVEEYNSIVSSINKNILQFVVTQFADSFSILRVIPKEEQIIFNTITEDEFPTFSELSFKAQVEEKIISDQEKSLVLNNIKRKRRLLQNFVIVAIVSIFAVIISFYISYKKAQSDKEADEFFATAGEIIQKIKERQDYQITFNKYNNNKIPDSLFFHNKGKVISRKELENLLYTNVEKRLHSSIEGRLKNVESMLTKEPEKTLSILELKSQVSELRTLIENKNNLYDEKISSLKERADLLSNLTWALALTVLATLVAGLIAAFQALKKG